MTAKQTSILPGRLRIRHPRLENSAEAHRILNSLKAVTTVDSVRINTRIGSLLLEFSNSVPIGEMLAVIRQSGLDDLPEAVTTQAHQGCTHPEAPLNRKFVKWGMMASLPVSLLGLAVGSKRLHTISGIFFSILAAEHIRQHASSFKGE